MLVHEFFTEIAFLAEKQRLNTLLGSENYTSFYEHSNSLWYIVHNEDIAHHMPEPILFVPVTQTQEPTSEEPI